MYYDMWSRPSRYISQLQQLLLHLVDKRLLVLVQPDRLPACQKNTFIVKEDLRQQAGSFQNLTTVTFFREAPVQYYGTGITVFYELHKRVWVFVEVAKICNFDLGACLLQLFPQGLIPGYTLVKLPPHFPFIQSFLGPSFDLLILWKKRPPAIQVVTSAKDLTGLFQK